MNNNNKIYIVLFLLLLAGVAKVADTLSFFYFNPDSAQSNLSQLKTDMDASLSGSQQAISFQAFSRHENLLEQVKAGKPSLLYVPFWYIQRYGKELGIKPLLYSSRLDKTTYQKKLITNISSNKSIAELENSTMAMTTMGPDSRTILDSIIFSKHKLDSNKLSIIEVPKDADAIFAVALGQVDSALVSESNLTHLKQRNPRLTAAVRVIGSTNSISLPILCYVEGTLNEKELESLRAFVLKNGKTNNKKITDILNIDAWSPGA